MPTKAFRKEYPQYDKVKDGELATALHAKFFSDMPKREFDMCCIGRPNHDDLKGGIHGKNSLEMMSMAPELKPAVKMPLEQAMPFFHDSQNLATTASLILPNGLTYIFNLDGLKCKCGCQEWQEALLQSIARILEEDDGEILGYPPRGPMDAAVNRDGEIITDLGRMKDETEDDNILWAADGEEEPLMEMAGKYSAAVKSRKGE